MMLHHLKTALRWVLISLNLFILLALLWILLAAHTWFTRLSMSVTLPNGMMFKRQFDWTRSPPSVLIATDGRTVLAREVEGSCFNDRYVSIRSYRRAQTGLYDAETDAMVPAEDHEQAMVDSGLNAHPQRKSCNGYYTGWVGPPLMFDGAYEAHLPFCDWRNLENPALRDRNWFDRPCRPP